MRIAVPRETASGERRVALAPEAVSRLSAGGFTVAVERDAGERAGFANDAYAQAGADVVDAASLLDGVAAVVRVAKPSVEEIDRLVNSLDGIFKKR